MTLTPGELEERLIEFGAAICNAVRRMPPDLVSLHVGRQLVRSATSPAANYAEARGAESRRDFIHKLQLCLKELRETSVWLRLARRLCTGVLDERLLGECSQLIAVFVKSINTSRARHGQR